MNEKVIFMGTPQIAADVLNKLLEAGTNVSLVVTQPDKKTGRKQKLTASPVKELAIEHNIPVFQPASIKKDHDRILEENADLIVTCAYGKIVPGVVLDAPKYGCVNLHGSILPEYRGAAPIQRAIWDGKTETGMALMRMEDGVDTGGVMDLATLEITDADNSTTMFAKMGPLAGDLIVKNLPVLLSGKAVFVPQDDSKATHAAKIEKEEEHLDLSKPGREVFNQMRALAEEPGGYVLADGRKLKILEADYVPGEFQEAGVLELEGKKGMSLGLKEGKLNLKKVQLEGKPAMDITGFRNGQGRNLAGKKVN